MVHTVLLCIFFLSMTTVADSVDEAVFALQRSQELRKSGTALVISGAVLMGGGAAMAYAYDSDSGDGALSLGLGITSFAGGAFLEVLGVRDLIASRRILTQAAEKAPALRISPGEIALIARF
ncbi:hypothetical protein [Chitinivibrio alkaliphilus]|uniref:Uncharacterized protein n=1 Tax=Chitinivibrio alkaliphilus ACht1 TaxID=1313304 RepID=U7D874_9BACT|nr:hypothetical protein [Chitinivibrio alkaliphilus]ERP31771.1 hypothetical protein CALK_1213 [Chitinivibrio alkaliphilus ACht1]